MKRFSFSLQTVQDQRQIRREAAEREYADAAAELAAASALLDKTIRERNAAIEDYTRLLESGGADPEEVTLRADHIALLTQRERERRVRLDLFERAKEIKRLALVASSRDEQAINNLRERHRARHDLGVARIEQTALDEMATIRFVRRCE
jgi:flagellar export protein FliJ